MESYLTAEVSASAVRANLELLRRGLSPGTRLCPVVKSDCYGLGVKILLNVISELSDCLAVATGAEALEVRQLGYGGPVLTLLPSCFDADHAPPQKALKELISQHITLTVVSPQEVAAVADVAAALGVQAETHVKIDTGMCRGGLQPKDAPRLAERIRGHPALRLVGMYTHFACAEHRDRTFTHLQLRRFMEAVAACGRRDRLILHAANSAATVQLPASHLDMVRPGIAVYGYQPIDDAQEVLPLRPALRLWARLMHIKTVPAGTGCGYGLTHTFRRDSRVGLVPVGYADGFPRNLSNKATMCVGGRNVPVCGNVSMDQTILDLTDSPEAKVGDVVEIISPDPSAANSVENLARLAGTISNEVISRLGRRARRILVD